MRYLTQMIWIYSNEPKWTRALSKWRCVQNDEAPGRWWTHGSQPQSRDRQTSPSGPTMPLCPTMHCALCKTSRSPNITKCSQSTVHYALYTMHYTLCTIHYALCTIHNLQIAKHHHPALSWVLFWNKLLNISDRPSAKKSTTQCQKSLTTLHFKKYSVDQPYFQSLQSIRYFSYFFPGVFIPTAYVFQLF